jgi:ionotropic glutamate receptor
MKRRVNGTTTFYGYCVDLIKDIQAIMGFEYELYEVPDGKYGNMDSKMNWNGMIKELMEKVCVFYFYITPSASSKKKNNNNNKTLTQQRADIGLGALAVMAERENVIDFTVPYYDLVGISILMAKPQVSTSLFKFLTVLENDVWGCILAAYFFTRLILFYSYDKPLLILNVFE